MVKSRAGLHGPHDAAGWSGFPDQFQIGAAESIRSAYTPLKPRTDGQPCHLSETTIYAAHSPQWWLVVASNQAVQRFTFLPPGPLTTQAMGPSPCCSLSPSPGPWITLHTYISEHCDNAALSKFTKIIGHCLEQL